MVMNTKLSKGDWIVHANYGLGQVQGEDVKELAGEKKEYYKVQTKTAEYWLPKNRVDADTIRDVASRNKFRKALKVLKDTPAKMNKDYRKRRSHIAEVISSNSVVEFAKLIRDLYWRKHIKKLNETEKSTFDSLKVRFAREWSVASEIKEKDALNRLENMLSNNLAT